MNTKLLIGALVASVILFVWSFLSWSMLNVHASQFKYDADQEELLSALADKLEDGQYFFPTAPPGASDAEKKELMQSSAGKPWAVVNYNSSFDSNMGMNMFRGWASGFLACLLLCWILLRFAELDLKTAVMASLAVGLVGYLSVSYVNSVWFEGNSLPELIDAVVPWALIGAWLGWWLNR